MDFGEFSGKELLHPGPPDGGRSGPAPDAARPWHGYGGVVPDAAPHLPRFVRRRLRRAPKRSCPEGHIKQKDPAFVAPQVEHKRGILESRSPFLQDPCVHVFCWATGRQQAPFWASLPGGLRCVRWAAAS